MQKRQIDVSQRGTTLTRLRSAALRPVVVLAGALSLIAGASQAQTFDVPQSVCQGQDAEITLDSTFWVSHSLSGFFVRKPSAPSWEAVEFELKNLSTIVPVQIVWNVSAVQPVGEYQLAIKLGAAPTPHDWNYDYFVEVKDCSSGLDLAAGLEQEVYELERQLWEEHVMSSTWPPEPGCWECSYYEVDVTELLSIFERSGLDQTLAVRVLDRRGRPFAEVGQFARVRGRYTSNPKSVTVETSTALAARSHCGMQIEVTDVSGNLFGTAPICLDVVGRR